MECDAEPGDPEEQLLRDGDDDDCDGRVDDQCRCRDDDECPGAAVCVDGACEGACEDDALEDNDALEEASPLVVGSHDELSICAGDEDWYAVEVCPGGTLTADVLFVHAEGDSDVQLRTTDGSLLGSSSSAADNERIRFTSDAARTVLLRVYGQLGAENAYALDLQLDGCAPPCVADECPEGLVCRDGFCVRDRPVCEDDALEDADGPATARSVEPGDVDDLRICEGDDDWYAVEVCAGGRLQIDVRFSHAAGDLDAELVAPDGRPLRESASVSDNETLVYSPAVDEQVLLHIYGFGGTANDYALEVALAGCAAPICVDDDAEENDAADCATPVVPPTRLSSRTVCPDDDDFYGVRVCAGGTLTARAAGLELAVLDAGGEVLEEGAGEVEVRLRRGALLPAAD